MSPGGLANPPPHTHTLSKRDTTRIGASDIWRPEEGGYFFFLQGQLSQGQLEFQNLSVANDSARQQLRSGSHRERERERDVRCFIYNRMDQQIFNKKIKFLPHLYGESCSTKSKRSSTEELSVEQGSDPGWIRLFDVSAAHSCRHGNHSLKGSNWSM